MTAKIMVRGLLAAALAASAVTVRANVFNMPGGQTSLSFVTVGDPGNAADGSGYGAVGYTYWMGQYDTTLAQYTAFLNAVASTDTYGLYTPGMASNFSTLGIAQSGSPGSYSYAVTGTAPGVNNMPVFDVTWGDAARFSNWLQNGQPTGAEGNGTTETGAYALSGATSNAALMAVTRSSSATYFIPSENEWYKAAYYVGGGTNAGYWLYPTKSNTVPSNVLSATGTNNANFYNSGYTDPTNDLTSVGAFADSPGPYGTYDMGGDLFQWNEANISGSFRGLRGCYWFDNSSDLASTSRSGGDPASEDYVLGFRVASSVAAPEPGSISLLLVGIVGLAGIVRRRRSQDQEVAFSPTDCNPGSAFSPRSAHRLALRSGPDS